MRKLFQRNIVSVVALAMTVSLCGNPLSAAADAAEPSARADLDAATSRMVNLTAEGVRILQSERAAAPNDNGSAAFPARSNAALANLTFRSSPTSVLVDMGAPLAAVGNWLATGSPDMLRFAINDINTLLSSQIQPNGAIFHSQDAADVGTMFFATHLGMAAMLLGDALPRADRDSWVAAVARAADYLVANRNLPKWDPEHNRWLDGWYTNGNIVIGNTLVEALAYKLTGLEKYRDNYERALDFAVAPRQARWPGYGFVAVVEPTSPTGSDGRGYFTEAGSAPGFDPDYTMLQADQLSRLFQVTGDPRVLRLLNMVVNQLLSRANTESWMMDGSNGSRHNYPSEILDTAGIATLAYQGGRADLLPHVENQSRVIDQEFRQVLKQQVPLGDRFLYALGMIPVAIITAGLTYKGAVAPPPAPPAAVPTRLTYVRATPVVTHGGGVVVIGKLARVDSGQALSGQQVELQYRPRGRGSFATSKFRARTDKSGSVRFAGFRPASDVDIRLRFLATDYLRGSTSRCSTTLVRRRVLLTADRAIQAHKQFVLYGSATPLPRPTQVFLQRASGRRWVTVATTIASSLGFRFTGRRTAPGTVRYRLIVGADASYARSTSAAIRVTLRR